MVRIENEQRFTGRHPNRTHEIYIHTYRHYPTAVVSILLLRLPSDNVQNELQH